MNNETKYKYINNLPKEYNRVIWDIMIKAESNKFVNECEKLTKKDCKLIMKYLYKITTENKELKDKYERCKKQCNIYKTRIDKLKEYINNLYADEYISYSNKEELLNILKSKNNESNEYTPKEDKKIEKIKKVVCDSDLIDRNHFVIEYLAELKYKINEIIDKINGE